MTCRISIINDHPLVVEGLRAMLRPYPSVDVVELDTKMPTAARVDLALMDTYALAQPLDTALRERLADPMVGRVAVYTWQADADLVADAMEAGASGVLSKAMPAQTLATALATLCRGGRVVPTHAPSEDDEQPHQAPSHRNWPGRELGLSMREAEMITLITQGLTNEQIAKQLYLSPNSVKSYIRSAYHKIGVDRRSQAVAWGIDHDMRPRTSQQFS